MSIQKNFLLVEEILATFEDALGGDLPAYRNHVYRVVNLCYFSGEFSQAAKDKFQIAGAFHDIGIWTNGTLDYLPPSMELAAKYLMDRGWESWATEIGEMIEMHHCTRSCADSAHPLVEPFRRADVADFSLGHLPMGFPKALIVELKATFPNRGFHLRLLQLGSAWFLRHPLNPLPMFRF